MKLNWVEALNEQTVWISKNDAALWLKRVVDPGLEIKGEEIDVFLDRLDFLREQLTALHFGSSPDFDGIEAILATVTPTLNVRSAKDGSPMLMARAASNSVADIIRSVCDTLVLQFAGFLSESLDAETAPRIVRCGGLFREEKEQRKRLGALDEQSEQAWRAEVTLLQECEPELVNEIQRCEDFFVVTAKAKFCSDACRFSTFQITKQLKEPGYMKEKQKRYRDRKEKH